MLAAYLYIQLCRRAAQKQNQTFVGQGAKILTRMLTSLETSAFARDAWAFDFKEENIACLLACLLLLFVCDGFFAFVTKRKISTRIRNGASPLSKYSKLNIWILSNLLKITRKVTQLLKISPQTIVITISSRIALADKCCSRCDAGAHVRFRSCSRSRKREISKRQTSSG